MKYGATLKTHRLENGYTLQYIAEKTGISKQNLSRWERDEVEPTISFCSILADFYGISIDELIGRELTYTEKNTTNTINNSGIFNNTGTIKF